MTSWSVFSESSDKAVGKVETKGGTMASPKTVHDSTGRVVGHTEYDSKERVWKIYDSRGNYRGRCDDTWLDGKFYDAHGDLIGSTSIGPVTEWQSLAQIYLFEADGRTRKKEPLGHMNLAEGNDPTFGLHEATAAATLLLLL